LLDAPVLDGVTASTDNVFAALGDPTRRQVLALVGRRGPLSATELADQLPVSRQAVMKHLDLLRAAGLVACAKDGRAVRYALRSEPLDDAAAWMASVGSAWDRRLSALAGRAGANNRKRRR
jgi:DNA-binding transcriptional ArsR family regulator